MINDFIFAMRTSIRYGKGIIATVGDVACEFNAKKALLVADQGIRKTPLPGRVTEALQQAGLSVVDFDQIVPNPRITDCEAGARLGQQENVDIIVAVGGGSSIDTSKAIAAMLGHNTTDFSVVEYPKTYTCEPYPLIAIPTTAGTGSEVTTCGVITDEVTHKKEYCIDPKCAPNVALCDPEALMGLPASIAAACGIDALTHAIEGYVNRITCPVTEAFGLLAIKLLYNNFRKYIFDRDVETCGEIMIGSMLAGLSFGYSDTASVHALAETLGGYYDIPHGVANAIFLADVCDYSISGNMQKYVEVAKALGIHTEGLSDREAAAAGAAAIRTLVEDVKIPKLNSFERVNPDDFDLLAQRCYDHLSNVDNPRILSKEDYLYLLNKAYNA